VLERLTDRQQVDAADVAAVEAAAITTRAAAASGAVIKIAAAVAAAAVAAAEAATEAAALLAAHVAEGNTAAADALGRTLTVPATRIERVVIDPDTSRAGGPLGSPRTSAKSGVPDVFPLPKAVLDQFTVRHAVPEQRDHRAGDRRAAPAIREGLVVLQAHLALAAEDRRAGTVNRERARRDRVEAAADRAAAASDRHEAASDRRGAAESLQVGYRDDLTGTLLRAAGREQLNQALGRATRTGESVVFAFLDVDDLKGVNEAHGQAEGDRLLRELGSALRHQLRSYDVVVRYGGDEFVCALPGSELPDARSRLAEIAARLRSSVVGAYFSRGLAQWEPGEALEHVIARADSALHEQKEIHAGPRRSGR
jgi:diguanylate cyclase (GGDEF)-like protein